LNNPNFVSITGVKEKMQTEKFWVKREKSVKITKTLFSHLAMRFSRSESARREVLARLLHLNHKRYEDEVKGRAS